MDIAGIFWPQGKRGCWHKIQHLWRGLWPGVWTSRSGQLQGASMYHLHGFWPEAPGPRECALLGRWLRLLSRLGSRQHSTPLDLFPFQILLGFFWSYLNNGANLTSIWEVYSAAAAKSFQSCLTLCDPIDSRHQAPPSLGFSRQEHWSGLPFPSPMHESEKWKWSRSVVSDS